MGDRMVKKQKVHVGTAAAALGNNLAASLLAIATRLEQIELVGEGIECRYAMQTANQLCVQ